MSYDVKQVGLSACLQLFHTPRLGNLSFGRLVEAFGSAQNALQKNSHQWQEIGLNNTLYNNAQKPPPSQILTKIEKWLAKSAQHHIISYDCSNYPASLRALIDPPAILYAHGDLSAFNKPNIAIIGSRQASPLGLKTTEKFAYELASAGLSICSGLALGIDACAHLGALSAGAPTVAFMGTGVDVIYPTSNNKLAQEMVQNKGLLVSELPLGTHPRGSNFPPRNRLICGLSTHGVVVIESKAKGGSMITARLANEQGLEVFAVPGSIQSPLSEGCHLLIQQGAKLVCNTQDILTELNDVLIAQITEASQENAINQTVISDDNVSIPPNHQKILTAMNYEIIRTEDIAQETKLSITQLSTALLELELQGKVTALSGQRWQRTEN